MSGTAITTYGGLKLDLAEPDPASIRVEDIAAGLSKVCRFGGQSLRFYSVAQHAISVSLAVQHLGRPELALAALHHDSHEAYVCDVPLPAKRLLEPAYGELTARLDAAIATALGAELPQKDSAEGRLLKAADDAVLHVEAEGLLAHGAEGLLLGPGSPGPDEDAMEAARAALGGSDEAWSFATAEENFLRQHAAITRT